MKTKLRLVSRGAILLLLLLSILNNQLSTAFAQSTAFTYQGRLNDGANAASGIYDLRFGIYDAASAGTQEGSLLTNSATTVSSGLFTVTLDFGNQFPGTDRWLEIAVRTNGGVAFDILNPRQKLTPAPYAIMAGNVRGLIVQPNTNDAPNIIQGSSFNFVASGIVGATISGGGKTNSISLRNSVTADFGTVSGGLGNTAGGIDATVSGGAENDASQLYATVGGGFYNTASGEDATVSGGSGNLASHMDATASGGYSNFAIGDGSTVGGGFVNTASGMDATVSGGNDNVASGVYATVSGGVNNAASGTGSFAAGAGAQAIHNGSFVWGDESVGLIASTTNNQFSVRSTGGARFITGTAGLKLGSTAQYFAPGGSENLRILRGVVDSAGNVLHGSGFTATRTGTGAYTVTFDGAFGDFPVVTVAAQSGLARMATTTNVGNFSAQIRTFDASGAAVDAQFHFIAMGPQ